MTDEIIRAILEAEEQADREISEAKIEADRIKANPDTSVEDVYNRIVESCKKKAEESKREATQRAKERVKKIMSECESEVSRLRSLDEKTVSRAVELVLKEIMSGAVNP
jgi:vacuolar-type H+-ATPase subunit H